MHMANEVYFRGGKAKERELAALVVDWCIKEMMPRIRTLDISLEFDGKIEAYGYCMNEDFKGREFTLTIKKGLSFYDLVSTIVHEMIHVKQYAKKELRDVNGKTKWKTKDHSKTPYSKAPWELQAFRMEEKLALKCIKTLNFSL
jgi:hypothetical protein